jgi:hypothetical protein
LTHTAGSTHLAPWFGLREVVFLRVAKKRGVRKKR